MSAAVLELPTRANVEQAWEEYHALILSGQDDPRLLADLDFCMKLARAWKRWEQLFLSWDGRC